MGADFEMRKEQPQGRPDVVVFHMKGWLDAQSEQKFVDTVKAAKDAGARYVLLDMVEMGTVTSAGIRAIHKAYLMMTPKEETGKVSRVKLCNTPAPIYQILSMTGLLINVPTYESEMDAVESFGA